MGRLFGTDGIRGIANTEISCELALKIGRAAATVLFPGKENERLRVIIGTDTRKSGDMLTAALAAGFCSAGCDVYLLGVVPTPAVAFLVKEYSYDAGVMISASHNTDEYNGIKIFSRDGYKLPDETEEKIEAIIFNEVSFTTPVIGGKIGNISVLNDAVGCYLRHIEDTARFRADGIKIAIDCANGSASVTAEKLFTELGAECTVINCEPDGVNINKDCGSTHIETLQEFMKGKGYDIGFSFDGDADRLLAVDEDGRLVDGDKIIASCSKAMMRQGRLKKNSAVVTVMSNLGLLHFFEKHGISCVKTNVGDRYVLEKMLALGCNIGGEQSGHVIFSDFATTGDGQLTAVQLLNVIKETGKSLRELADEIEIFPQVLVNVRVSSLGKLRLNEDEEIRIAIEEAERELAGDGRVLVRASGTEPLVRVMLEGKNEEQTRRLAALIAGVIKERLI